MASRTTRRVLTRRAVLVAAASAVTLGAAGCTSRSGTPPASVQPGADATDVDPSELVVFRVDGDEFSPRVEIDDALLATITWIDVDAGTVLGTGDSPTLRTSGVRRVGMHATAGRSSALPYVTTLNLGFSHEDDYGRLSLDSEYDHEPQPVASVSGLGLLTGLKRFCAAHTPLAGKLDLSGLAELEHVECYRSELEEVDLAGCFGLVRLVVEACRLETLDLGPVRENLQDLRAAIQRSDGLTFAPLDGPMASLYHYCVREQRVHGLVPHSQLPVVEEYWVWGTDQTTCDAPTSPALRSFLARDNAYDEGSVDGVLVALATVVPADEGRVDLSGASAGGPGSAPPSATGVAAGGTLKSRGWRVSTN